MQPHLSRSPTAATMYFTKQLQKLSHISGFTGPMVGLLQNSRPNIDHKNINKLLKGMT